MNKKIFAAAIAASLLMTGCQAAQTEETEVPASQPSETEASAAESATPTPTPTATPAPADDVPSLEDMEFEDVVLYILEDNLLTENMVQDFYGSDATVEDYIDDRIDETQERYFGTDANEDAGIVNVVEINFYTYLEDEGCTDCVEVKVIEVDPDTIDDYKVGGDITVHYESSVEYYDENDELVVSETVEDVTWPIAAISGNYILVAQEYTAASEVNPTEDISEVEFSSANSDAPYQNEKLQATYDAFVALG